MRLDGKVAVVVGAGQTAGTTLGNGRATAMLFAREGATVLAVDRDGASAEETCRLIAEEGGEAAPFEADIRSEDACRAFVAESTARWDRIDVLHNNVGIGSGDGDAQSLDERGWDRIMDVNLKGMWLSCRTAITTMREQSDGGSVVNVSSIAAVCASPLLGYKVSKAAVNALTHQLAMDNARYGIRVNAVMPGLIDTPMAIEGIAQAFGVDREELRASRDRMVPLRRHQGTAWDVAHAALFLASDEAAFITGVVLPVDGGQSGRIG
jgi:NAD(P)-dependent dehydrogenase (short-subunit alcohol dehydrogenase family)